MIYCKQNRLMTLIHEGTYYDIIHLLVIDNKFHKYPKYHTFHKSRKIYHSTFTLNITHSTNPRFHESYIFHIAQSTLSHPILHIPRWKSHIPQIPHSTTFTLHTFHMPHISNSTLPKPHSPNFDIAHLTHYTFHNTHYNTLHIIYCRLHITHYTLHNTPYTLKH